MSNSTPSTPPQYRETFNPQEEHWLTNNKKHFPTAYEKIGFKPATYRNENCFAFPLPNGHKIYRWKKANKTDRWEHTKGSSSTFILNGNFSEIIVTEGEFDFCACIENDIQNVATGTGGAETFKKEWAEQLRNKTVFVAYDNDEAGKNGAIKVAKLLISHGCRVYILNWPEWIGNGGDIRDFFYKFDKTKEDFLKLIKENSTEFIEKPKEPEKTQIKFGKFEMTTSGLFAYVRAAGSNKPINTKISAAFEVRDQVRNMDQQGWGRTVVFKDFDNEDHEVFIENKLLLDASAVAQKLADSGLWIAVTRNSRELVCEALNQMQPRQKVRVTDSTGFHGACFIMPTVNLGVCNENYIFQSSDGYKPNFGIQGTLFEWQQKIGRYISGNSNLIAACCTVFAAPLLDELGQHNFGFNFFGPSSTGKTTILQVAASLYGKGATNGGAIQTWRATSNGIEAIAKAHNDLPMCLDELGECDPKKASETVYMIGNGQTKARANKFGDSRPRKTFHTTLLSTSEESLQIHLAKAQIEIKAGQAVRFLDISSSVNELWGAFENIHDFPTSQELVSHLKNQSKITFGQPFRQFIIALSQEISRDRELFVEKSKGYRKIFSSEFSSLVSSSYQSRIVGIFSVLYCAGLLAFEYGVLPVSEADLRKNLLKVLTTYLERSVMPHPEENIILEKIKFFFEKHGSSRFEVVAESQTNNSLTGSQKTYDRAGIKGSISNIDAYFVFPTVFKKEICKGYDDNLAKQILDKHGLIIKDSEGKFAVNKTIDSQQTRMVAINMKIHELEI